MLFTEAIAGLDEATLLDVFGDAPSTRCRATRLELPLVDALVRSGLAASKSAARSTVSGGGAYVNNRRVEDTDARITTADLLHDRYVVLRKGKRDHHLLRFG